MQAQMTPVDFGPAATVTSPEGAPEVLVVCEHASNHIPAGLHGLGLSEEAQLSHVAWDPGALGVAEVLAVEMGAVLVAGTISRLVYDCNRPPEAPSAVPERSEAYEIVGNQNLSESERATRVTEVYRPFAKTVAEQITQYATSLSLMVTIHSFTPVFHGRIRDVELGILHGQDARFAKAMLQDLPAEAPYETRLNEPYSAADGVAHTLDVQGAANGLLNVMIEIRNDLIATTEAQRKMAAYLLAWINATRVAGEVA